MARSPFSIFSRKGPKGKIILYARFLDSSGKPIKTVTLRDARTRTHAARLAQEMLANGIISSRQNPNALEYLYDFWRADSDYAKGRALRGHTLSDWYIRNQRDALRLHAASFLSGLHLLDIAPSTLESIILDMAKKNLSPRSINKAIQSIRVPYAHFCRLHRLANTLPSIEKVREHPKERGILTIDELKALLAVNESPRVRAAVYLAALCGLRLGEIRGLQWDDIDEAKGIITICHNFVSNGEGLKRPKWESDRIVPIPAPVLEILHIVRGLPGSSPSYVVFNEDRPDAPIEQNTLARGFRRMLVKIGITKEARETRNLCMHGLRHLFVTLSRSAGLPDYVVMRLAGHRSPEMMERYSHGEKIVDFQAARIGIEAALSPKAASK